MYVRTRISQAGICCRAKEECRVPLSLGRLKGEKPKRQRMAAMATRQVYWRDKSSRSAKKKLAIWNKISQVIYWKNKALKVVGVNISSCSIQSSPSWRPKKFPTPYGSGGNLWQLLKYGWVLKQYIKLWESHGALFNPSLKKKKTQNDGKDHRDMVVHLNWRAGLRDH